MKRILPALIALGVGLAFVATLIFLFLQSRTEEEVFETASPAVTDIVLKTVATGAIVPRNEVAIKPRVSGILEELALEPGARVKKGDLIARIRVQPDASSLSGAQSRVRSAQINLQEAQAEMDRVGMLMNSGAIAGAEYTRTQTRHALAREELAAAAEYLQLVRDGASRGAGDLSTEVRSTVDGMVLDVPVREGESVIESNTFNAGTTVALVADMSDMIFEGAVDESEVGRIREGMELSLVIGAIEDERFKGTLEYIAPKGQLDQGAVQFAIKAAIEVRDDVFIRAGVSANADIVLESRSQVLAIPEAVLQFEDDAVYVEKMVSEQVFERQDVEVGLSDGIHIEVLGGVSEGDELKRPG